MSAEKGCIWDNVIGKVVFFHNNKEDKNNYKNFTTQEFLDLTKESLKLNTKFSFQHCCYNDIFSLIEDLDKLIYKYKESLLFVNLDTRIFFKIKDELCVFDGKKLI